MSAITPVLVTTARRQPRPAVDLANLDRRIAALEALGDARDRRFAVALLRQKLDWLVRDEAFGGAQWATDAANLRSRIEREEAAHA